MVFVLSFVILTQAIVSALAIAVPAPFPGGNNHSLNIRILSFGDAFKAFDCYLVKLSDSLSSLRLLEDENI